MGATAGSHWGALVRSRGCKEGEWRSRRYHEILWGAARLLRRGTALVQAPKTNSLFPRKMQLKATQTIQDIWYIMVSNKMFSSVQLALAKREGSGNAHRNQRDLGFEF